MNELWLTVSKYAQAFIFAALTFGFGYYVFNGWLTDIVQGVDSLEATVGPIIVILKFFLVPVYFFQSLVAIGFAAQFSWAVFQLSLGIHHNIFGTLGPKDHETNHREMFRLSMLSAFWICARFVVPSVMGATLYYLLLRFGVIVAIVAATLTFTGGTYIAGDFYSGFMKSQMPQKSSLRGGSSSQFSKSWRR